MTKLVYIEPHCTFHDSTTLDMQLSVHVSRLRYRVFPSSRIQEKESKDQCLVVKTQSVLEMEWMNWETVGSTKEEVIPPDELK
jgi:hypothetical protein